MRLGDQYFLCLIKDPYTNNALFFSYDSVNALANAPHLSYMRDAILAEYEEFAEV